MTYETVDLYALMPAEGDPEQHLTEQGWAPFLALGSDDSQLRVQSWRRRKGTSWEYAVEVGDLTCYSENIVTDSLVEFMDLLARWAPAVQAAAVVGLVDEVGSAGLSSYGTVETVAARWAHGREQVLPQLRREEAASRAERARSRQARPGGAL